MKPATLIRTGLLILGVVALEICCQTGIIGRFAMVPPSQMVLGLIDLLQRGIYNREILQTLFGILISAVCSIAAGFVLGAVLHALPRARAAIDPYLSAYYSVPIFIFYPMFIALFGFNRVPIIVIGFLFAVVAMMTNTLNGLDRVPKVLINTARVLGLGRIATTTQIVLPSAFPYFITGVKFAVSYSFVGVLGAEFILSNQGLGYRIAFAFSQFNNRVMYALILLVLILVALVNMVLLRWERSVLQRRGLM